MRVGKKAFFALFFYSFLWGISYTNKVRTQVKGVGESLKKDVVESFNQAIENAKENAESQGEAYIKAYAAAEDAVFSSLWLIKKANLQVVDLQVLNYRFFPPQGRKGLITEVEVDIEMEYLDVPLFLRDWLKTPLGAGLRSSAIPGWGQFYNRQYTTGILFGIGFWSSYFFFIKASQEAGNDPIKRGEAFAKYQLPAILFWAFNVSEAVSSRYLGKQALRSLKLAYRLEDFEPKYLPKRTQGVRIDLLLFQIPLGGTP